MMDETMQAARDEVKKRLSAYRAVKAEMRQLVEEYERLKTLATAPGAQKMDGMPRGSGVGDPVGQKVEQLLALQERYATQLERLTAAQVHIEEMIEALEPTERTLLRHRYIEGLSWEGVCVAMSYSWRQTHNIHARALDKLVEMEGIVNA